MSKTTPGDILRKGKEILLEKGWCQGEFAKNDAGELVTVVSGDACEFCAQGAIMRAAWELGVNYRGDGSSHKATAYGWAEHHLVQGIEDVTGYSHDIAHWNDDSNIDEVIAAFDRGIECWEGQYYIKKEDQE